MSDLKPCVSKYLRKLREKDRKVCRNKERIYKQACDQTQAQTQTQGSRNNAKLELALAHSNQDMDVHLTHCKHGCKTMYEDKDIKSVTWMCRSDHCKKTGDNFYQLLAQDILTIEFVDGTLKEIAKQHYFCADEATKMCEISGNLSCHKCNARLYCACRVCGYVPDDVTYRFSKDKYKK